MTQSSGILLNDLLPLSIVLKLTVVAHFSRAGTGYLFLKILRNPFIFHMAFSPLHKYAPWAVLPCAKIFTHKTPFASFTMSKLVGSPAITKSALTPLLI